MAGVAQGARIRSRDVTAIMRRINAEEARILVVDSPATAGFNIRTRSGTVHVGVTTTGPADRVIEYGEAGNYRSDAELPSPIKWDVIGFPWSYGLSGSYRFLFQRAFAGTPLVHSKITVRKYSNAWAFLAEWESINGAWSYTTFLLADNTHWYTYRTGNLVDPAGLLARALTNGDKEDEVVVGGLRRALRGGGNAGSSVVASSGNTGHGWTVDFSADSESQDYTASPTPAGGAAKCIVGSNHVFHSAEYLDVYGSSGSRLAHVQRAAVADRWIDVATLGGTIYALYKDDSPAQLLVRAYNSVGILENQWRVGTMSARGQTTFYNYPTTSLGEKISLGTPDGGFTIPALAALEGMIPRGNTVTDIHTAISSMASFFINAVTGDPFNFLESNENNLYHVAVESGQYDWREDGDYGDIIREDLIDESNACLTKLEASALVPLLPL